MKISRLCHQLYKISSHPSVHLRAISSVCHVFSWDDQQGSQMWQFSLIICLERKRAHDKWLNLTCRWGSYHCPSLTSACTLQAQQHTQFLFNFPFITFAAFLAAIPKSKSLTILVNRENRGTRKGKAWGKQACNSGYWSPWHVCPDITIQCPVAKGVPGMEHDLLFLILTLASHVKGWAKNVGTETGNPVEIAGKKKKSLINLMRFGTLQGNSSWNQIWTWVQNIPECTTTNLFQGEYVLRHTNG